MWVLTQACELVNLARMDHIKIAQGAWYAIRAIRYLEDDAEFFNLAEVKTKPQADWLMAKILDHLDMFDSTLPTTGCLRIPHLLEWMSREEKLCPPEPTLETQEAPSETKSGET
jgi:hypothetical protein